MKVPLQFADLVATETEGGNALRRDDPFTQFLEDARIVGATGDWSTVEKFRAEAAKRDEPIAKHYRKLAGAVTGAKPAPAAAPLAKASGLVPDHVRVTLTAYLRKMFAAGEELPGIVAHARRFDPDTANQLAELGQEILGGRI